MEVVVSIVFVLLPALLVAFHLWSVDRAYWQGYNNACVDWNKARCQGTTNEHSTS